MKTKKGKNHKARCKCPFCVHRKKEKTLLFKIKEWMGFD
jgi:hypothetical protein